MITPRWFSLGEKEVRGNRSPRTISISHKKIYDLKKENAANQDDEVKKAQKALSDSGASSTNDSKYISIYI